MMRLLIITSAILCHLTPTSQAANSRPNVLFIMTDDQADWSLGCYGNRDAKTPVLDQLAAQGMRFRNAFVITPVCSPSRATTLTGLYPTQFGIADWITPAQADLGLGLDPVLPTWPKLVKSAGYQTGLVGKWHLGRKSQFHPKNNGFDFFAGHLDGGWSPKNPTLEIDGQPTAIEGFSVERTTDDAIRFLREVNSQPFALCVHYREPHTPYEPMPPQDTALFKDLDPAIPDYPNLKRQQVKNWTRQYHACVHAIDRNVGRILKALEETGQANDTIVIFTSDHGYNIGHHGIHTKGNGIWCTTDQRGVRPNMWDTSLRIPLIVRWPAMVKPGQISDAVVTNQDFLPTIAALAGVKPPPSWRGQGLDWSPVLRGESKGGREVIYGQYDITNTATQSMRMMRTAEWKLVRHYKVADQDELFDLRHDPGEMQNRFADPSTSAVRHELQAKLDAWMASIDDPARKLSSNEKPR